MIRNNIIHSFLSVYHLKIHVKYQIKGFDRVEYEIKNSSTIHFLFFVAHIKWLAFHQPLVTPIKDISKLVYDSTMQGKS